MKVFLLLLIVTFVCDVHAQKKLKFHSQNYIGLLEGEEGSKFQLQSINGFQSGTWFFGAGTGLDYYVFRSVPLFLSVNKQFCDCPRSLFISLDAGVNWVWDQKKDEGSAFRNAKYPAAPYWGPGLGYKIGLRNKKDAILVNIGYSSKRVKELISTTTFCMFPPCPESTEIYRYKLNRLSMKIGWQF